MLGKGKYPFDSWITDWSWRNTFTASPRLGWSGRGIIGVGVSGVSHSTNGSEVLSLSRFSREKDVISNPNRWLKTGTAARFLMSGARTKVRQIESGDISGTDSNGRMSPPHLQKRPGAKEPELAKNAAVAGLCMRKAGERTCSLSPAL